MICSSFKLLFIFTLLLAFSLDAGATLFSQNTDKSVTPGRHLKQINTEENAELLAEEEERQQELELEEEEELEWEKGSSGTAANQADDYEELAQGDEEEQRLRNSDFSFGTSDEELERFEEEAALEEREQQEEEGLQDYSDGGLGVSSSEIEASKAAALQEAASQVRANASSNSTKPTELESLPYDESIERAINAHLDGGVTTAATNASHLTSSTASAGASREDEGAAASTENLSQLFPGQKSQISSEALGATLSNSEEEEEAAYESAIETLEEGKATNQSAGSQGRGSINTMEENRVKTSNLSVSATSEEGPARNASIMTQGAILGTTIGGMVKDNSSSIAGVIGLIIAGAAGIGVAFAGISLYHRFRNRRVGGKSLPRIIEIGALSGRKPKSPSYARVNDKNQDQVGYSGTQWPESDEAWHQGTSNAATGAHEGAVKHKKAWDWDADW